MQCEPMDSLNTFCLRCGRLVVTAGEETTDYDVIRRRAYAMPESVVSQFAGASVIPHLDPVGNVDKDTWFERPDNDSGARSVAIVCCSWAEVEPAIGD